MRISTFLRLAYPDDPVWLYLDLFLIAVVFILFVLLIVVRIKRK